jgi:hypothetical protein
MVEPIPQWNPVVLRQIGIAFCVISVLVLASHHIPDLKQNSKLRFLLVVSIVIMVISAIDRYPVVTELLTIAVTAGVVVIPLAVCVQTYWVIVTTN